MVTRKRKQPSYHYRHQWVVELDCWLNRSTNLTSSGEHSYSAWYHVLKGQSSLDSSCCFSYKHADHFYSLVQVWNAAAVVSKVILHFDFFFESNVNFYVRKKKGVLNVLLLFNMTDNEVLPQKHIYSTKILSNTRMVWQSNTKLYEKLMFYKSLYPMHQLILLRYRYLYR